MATSSGIIPSPYLCELCQPRSVMVNEAIGLQRRKNGLSNNSTSVRLTSSAAAFHLPRSNVLTTSQAPSSIITPNQYFLPSRSRGHSTAIIPLSVLPIQPRFNDVRASSTGQTLYRFDSTTLHQFSSRFINMDASVVRQQCQSSYVTAVGSQRSSKRKQDLFTLAGESIPTFEITTNAYSYDDTNIVNGQHVSISANNDYNAPGGGESSDLSALKFYRASSSNLDVAEVAKPQSTGSLTAAVGEVAVNGTPVNTIPGSVPEPAFPEVAIWNDSYEKAAETRLSDALKQRIRNIFLNPSERELKTLQMANSFPLSRGHRRCRIASFEPGRKGLIATERIYPNQPIIEYKGHAMLIDEYSQLLDHRRQFNPFVLFYKQLDKAVICLDASNYGNETRFIQRSCMPNCEVRLMFPPTDSFSSVVNPQCIQFVVTSSANRVIPSGTELTVGFDFDYKTCYYAVRCACGRGAPLCPVTDWFRRRYHLFSRDCSNLEERHRCIGDDQEEDDYESDNIDDECTVLDYQCNRNAWSHRSRQHHGFGENPTLNRVALRRLLNPKRISPAFSRVPHLSSKLMMQGQRRTYRNGVSRAFPLKRKSGIRGGRGSGGSRGKGLSHQQQHHLRISRPRGRPLSSSIKRNPVHRTSPLYSPSQRHNSDVEVEKRDIGENGANHPASSTSSSPRTDVTEPGATSPMLLPVHSPTTESQVQCIETAYITKKGLIGKGQKTRQRNLLKIHPAGESLIDASCGSFISPIRSPEADSLLIERVPDDPKLPISVISKAKRFRKTSGHLFDCVNNASVLPESGGSPMSKCARRQSDLKACAPSSEQGEKECHIKGQSLSRSCKSREDNWLAEVMSRIERMEKKRKKNPTAIKVELERGDYVPLQPRLELQCPKSLTPDKHTDKEQINIKEEMAQKLDEETIKAGLLADSNKIIPSPITFLSAGLHQSTTPLSREDRWMQWRIRRIAETKSSDPLFCDRNQQSADGSFSKRRRRAITGTKSYLAHCSPPKKGSSNDGIGRTEGNAECSLIVYNRREQDPMAKFSRSRTGHHRRQKSFLSRSYSLVESFADEDLPAGGELLDDHTVAEAYGTTSFNDVYCSNAVTHVGFSSPPKRSKKRWLSLALMKEGQQHQINLCSRTTSSPEDSIMPPASAFVPRNNQNQRALNLKKRIISQMEETMAQLCRYSPQPNSPKEVSPSSDVFTPASLPLKKRLSEEASNEVRSEAPKKPKPEKVRMSLAEYRRRRGLSTDLVESETSNKVQCFPIAPPVLSSTPPGSPIVDLKRLAPSAIPPGGPRTPSEPSSDDGGNREDVDLSKPPTVSKRRSQQHPLSSAPAASPVAFKEAAERFHRSFNADSPKKTRASPPRRPPGGCDRHLSGHAQRRASPPPPPHLGFAPPLSPSTSHLPPVQHVLLRDREILQSQMGRKHQSFARPLQSTLTHRGGIHWRSSSISTPPQSAARSHFYHDLIQPLTPTSPTTAFNHNDMESIQEALRHKHLSAQRRDLQKAATSGGG